MYTKVCVICGKEFETNKPNKMMCCSPHPKKCLQCGSTFYVTIYNKDKKFCDTRCSGEYRKQSGNGRVYAAKATETREKRYGTKAVCVTSKHRTCLICGKAFTPKSNNRQACYDEHFKPCCICSKLTKVTVYTYRKDVTCSKACMLAKREQTMVKQYGVKGSEGRKFNDKKIQTNRLNYGVDWAQQNTEVINRRKNTNLQKYGFENPIKSKQVRNKIKQTCLQKYGVDNPMKSEAVKQKIAYIRVQKIRRKQCTSSGYGKAKYIKYSTRKIWCTLLLHDRGLQAKQRSHIVKSKQQFLQAVK